LKNVLLSTGRNSAVSVNNSNKRPLDEIEELRMCQLDEVESFELKKKKKLWFFIEEQFLRIVLQMLTQSTY